MTHLSLGIKKKDMHSFKVTYLDGNEYNFQRANLHLSIPNGVSENDYHYIIQNISETGIMFDNGIRIGKKGDTRKTFHNLADALQYYDSKYGTKLLLEYNEYLKASRQDILLVSSGEKL